METKMDHEEGKKMWINFQRFALYDDFKSLYGKVVPEISKFEQKIYDYYTAHLKNQAIIRRFDTIISEKASKIDFENVNKHIMENCAERKEFSSLKEQVV